MPNKTVEQASCTYTIIENSNEFNSYLIDVYVYGDLKDSEEQQSTSFNS